MKKSQLIYWVYQILGHPKFKITSYEEDSSTRNYTVNIEAREYTEEASDEETSFLIKTATVKSLQEHFTFKYLDTVRYTREDKDVILKPIRGFHDEDHVSDVLSQMAAILPRHIIKVVWM